MAWSTELNRAIDQARGARRDALQAAMRALEAADPRRLVSGAISFDHSILTVRGARYDLGAFRKVMVLGAGKASGLMAVEVERILGTRIDDGVVIVPESQRGLPSLKNITFEKSTHPLPTKKGAVATMKMLEVAESVGKGDLVIFLASGGGSSLMSLPLSSVPMEDLKGVTSLLLLAGADIGEINCVRKHLSQIAGGRLVEKVHGAKLISIIISDVVGDDLGSISSGPTVPDPTTFSMARLVLEKYRLWKTIPPSVRRTIESGVAGKMAETPKPGNPVFRRVRNVLVGSNKYACLAAKARLEQGGYHVELLQEPITGEARLAGKRIAGLSASKTVRRPWGAVGGGEATVRVSGHGRGGRNQELALSAALALRGTQRTTVLSLATDGIDGVTDAAGAIADSTTYERARSKGLDPVMFLESNDSYSFFESLGDLVVTGPTGTNVNDVTIILKEP